MCGLCGVVRRSPEAPAIDRQGLLAAREAMRARGPDGEGAWFSADGRAALAHRRLAVLDLSPAGAQPMASADGRYRIVYNGEVVNFRELRRGLEADGERFVSESDTEVILALWRREGEAALGRLRGMFALAIWDDAESTLTLARDPFGIKPLYWSESGGVVRFASQVRALEAGGGVSRAVEPAARAGFLLWGAVPEPWAWREGVRAVPAGHVVRFAGGRPAETRPFALVDGEAAPFVDAFDDSVRAHLVSDVPVAIFLSAGLDSAAVAAAAVRHLAEPPVTFTLTFEGWEGSARDEGPWARRVAERLGARHVERRLGRAEITAAWPRVLAAMDQPSIDGFNTWLVASAAAQEGIKVALSGLGGDELLGGYPSFRDVPRWRRAASIAGAIPGAAALWPAAVRPWSGRRPKLGGLLRHGRTLPGAWLLRRGLFLPEELPAILGEEAARDGLERLGLAAALDRAAATPAPGVRGSADGWATVQRLEATLYMRNQLLRDSDWAAMASGVELRVPFVDVPLWRAGAAAGFEPARSGGKAAWARRVAPELPEALFARPKSGFTVPVAEWMAPPPRPGEDRPGLGSRRLARAVLAEWGG